MNEWYWKHFQRQHRTLGNYLALQAWVRNLDCIVLVREDLESFFGIENTTKKYIKHFTLDIKPYFPFYQTYYRENSETYVRFLFLSRVEFALPSRHGQMSASQLIKVIGSTLPKTARFSTSDAPTSFRQEEIISYLAVLAAGLKIPQIDKKNAELIKPRAPQPIFPFRKTESA